LPNKAAIKFTLFKTLIKNTLETIARNKDLRLIPCWKNGKPLWPAGTKLNLNYAIADMLDEDDQMKNGLF